jgi:hypothetical protein
MERNRNSSLAAFPFRPPDAITTTITITITRLARDPGNTPG